MILIPWTMRETFVILWIHGRWWGRCDGEIWGSYIAEEEIKHPYLYADSRDGV